MLNPTTLIKLMVLLLLGSADCPVATSTLYDFFLGKGYTDYFSLNKEICTLVMDGYLESSNTYGSTFLTITDKGRETIAELNSHISRGIKEDISSFLDQNGHENVNRASVTTNYYFAGLGDYVADLGMREKYNDFISIKINVPSEEGVRNICDNWRDEASDIYTYVLSRLLKTRGNEN